MSLKALNEDEKRIVFECLRAAVYGPFFPEWEFHTLFGLYRHEVASFVAVLPAIDDSNASVSLAINGAMNNLLGYPHGEDAAWPEFVSVSASEVKRVFEKWRHEKPVA